MNGEESVFEAIVGLRGDVSEISSDLSRVKNDIDWIKEAIRSIADNQKSCSACSNSKYLNDQADKNRDDIKKLQTDRNIIYGMAIATAILVNILAFYLQTWGKL